MHTFYLDALLPSQYGIDKLFRGLTQSQRHPSGSQFEGAATEGGLKGFVYSRCSGPYGCTGTTSCSMGGQRPLMGLPMRWRVLWQPCPPDQGDGVA